MVVVVVVWQSAYTNFYLFKNEIAAVLVTAPHHGWYMKQNKTKLNVPLTEQQLLHDAHQCCDWATLLVLCGLMVGE